MAPRSGRRAWLRRAAALAVAGAASACGFELRRQARLPFERIAVDGFGADSLLAAELKRQLAQQVQLVDAPARADVVLQALAERFERVVVASTSAAQVRELELRLRLRFRVATPAGRELVAPVELIARRELRYNETAALAKTFEQVELERDMRADLTGQVLRRLAAIAL